jgi:hypothetical protein
MAAVYILRTTSGKCKPEAGAGVNPNGSVVESSMRCGRECTVDDPGCGQRRPKQGRAAVKRPPNGVAWRPQQDAGTVREAMALLSDSQRAMIYRSLYLGRTTTQIAAELGTNGEAVKHELHRALHSLRMTLQLGPAG